MLCGVYQLDGSPPSERLRTALARVAGVPLEAARLAGPLAVALPNGCVSGPGPACTVHGRVHDLEGLRSRLGPEHAELGPEQLLNAAWGRLDLALLEQLRGEFVLVARDADGRGARLAVDRLGRGSLYFHTDSGRVTFASEVRGVLALLATRPAPDEIALAHWLAVSGPPDGRTLYAGVRSLRDGHLLELAPGSCEERRWWRPRYEPIEATSDEAVVGELRKRLETAVARAAGGGDGTGILLSGGLDSTAVSGLASRVAGAGLPAYSAVFPRHRAVDERTLIERTVSELGLRSAMIEVTGGSPLGGSLEYLSSWELPPSSPNLFFWLPLLRRAAADGIRAMLDGEGGDELFGVARYLLADRVRQARPLAALRLARRFPGAGERPPWPPVLRVLREYGLRGATRVGRPVELRPAPPWLSDALVTAYQDSHDPWYWSRGDGPRWRGFARWLLTSTNGAVLARDQVRHRSAMAGIEPRQPLLDADLVEYVLRLDPELSFDPHRSRPLLRAAVRGMIPEEVRLRRGKSTFDALFHEGLLGRDLRAVRALLEPSGSEVAGLIKADVLKSHLLDAPGSESPLGRQAWALYTWRLATAECWLQAQSDPDAPRRQLAGLDAGRHTFAGGSGPFFSLAQAS